VILQQAFLPSPSEYDIDNLFFIINHCQIILFAYLLLMFFSNHIIKLANFIELSQVNYTSQIVLAF